ncbi:Protein SRG-45 [Aphelenchoides avenae]|nr:Protein SRG-45 [Aphelenchus avenae]
MINAEDVKAEFALAYAIPSFIVSSVIVFAIVRSFKASFYRLYALAMTMDMIMWILWFVASRASNAPIFYPVYALLPEKGPLLTGIEFVAYYLSYVQYGTTLSFTLNRFSVVALPSVYVKLWKKYFYAVLAVIFVCPLPLTYHILVAGGYCRWDEAENHYRIDVYEDGTEKRNALFMMFGSALLGILVVCMNITIALVLYRTRRTSLTGRVDKKDTRDTESKLFFLTCIMFSFTVVTAVIQGCFYFWQMSWETFLLLLTIQVFAGDLHTCSSPWFLLLMSRAVREEVLNTVPFLTAIKLRNTVAFTSRATSTV